MPTPKIALLMTGNELMNGDVVDSNSSFVARYLLNIGLSISQKVTIGDDRELLNGEIDRLSHYADLLIINGGLGSTLDDLTAEALADVTQRTLTLHEEAHKHLQQWANQRGRPLSPASLKQATLPDQCQILPNPVGTAVGIQLEHNDCLILATPGVPHELERMLKDTIVDLVERRFHIAEIPKPVRFKLFGLSESRIQQQLSEHILNDPKFKKCLPCVDIGFRVEMPLVELKLLPNLKEDLTDTRINDALNLLKDAIKDQFHDYIIGYNKDNLPTQLVARLQENNKTIATAESCTGGMISSMLTSVPGASEVFHAGLVTYSNEMKTSLLGVDPDLFKTDGAVSEPVVRAMARGVLKISDSDYAIAVSGIAGPGGGSPEKPVGTVWIAWGDKSRIEAKQICFKAPRAIFQEYIAALGLDLIRRKMQSIKTTPAYLKRT